MKSIIIIIIIKMVRIIGVAIPHHIFKITWLLQFFIDNTDLSNRIT